MELATATDCHDYANEMAYVARKALKLPFATPDCLIDAAATVLRRMYVTINDREAAFQYVLPRGVGATAFLAGVLPVWLALIDQRIPPVLVVVPSGIERVFHRREIASIIPPLAQAIYPYHTGLRLQDVIGGAENRLYVVELAELAGMRWTGNRPFVTIFDAPSSVGFMGDATGERTAAVLREAARYASSRLAHVALAFGADDTEGGIIGRGHLHPPLWINRYNPTSGDILRRWWGVGVQPTVEEVTA